LGRWLELIRTDALDTAGVGDLGPLPQPHAQLGVVQAERPELDHCVTAVRFRPRDLPGYQLFRTAETILALNEPTPNAIQLVANYSEIMTSG
jgi:hypothetical protein